MKRRAVRMLALLAPACLAGCSSNPERDPLIIIGTVIGYLIFFGAIALVVNRALFGPPD